MYGWLDFWKHYLTAPPSRSIWGGSPFFIYIIIEEPIYGLLCVWILSRHVYTSAYLQLHKKLQKCMIKDLEVGLLAILKIFTYLWLIFSMGFLCPKGTAIEQKDLAYKFHQNQSIHAILEVSLICGEIFSRGVLPPKRKTKVSPIQKKKSLKSKK